MSTLKTHNLQSSDSGSVNISLTPNAGMVVSGISTFSNNLIANTSVGIGTDNPASDLHINSAVPTIRFTDSDTSQYSDILQSGHSLYISGDRGSSGSGGIIFRTQGTNERLRITSAGRVGINETSPDSLLHVSTNTDGTTDILTLHADADGTNNGVASIKLMGNAGNHAAFIKGGHTTNGDTILTFHTDAHASGINPEERMRITSAGDTELRNDVAGINDSYSQYLKFRTTQSNGQSAITGAIRAQGKSNWGGELVFYSKPANGTPNDTVSERLRITSAGDFGIGTDSPDRKLDVSGTGNVYGKFQSTNTTGAGIEVKDSSEDWLIQADGGVGPGLAFYDLGRTSYRMNIDSSGKVGINRTSPSYMLDVKSPNPGNDSKTLIQRWMSDGQNTLELNMYGGSVDQNQFAATNAEQTISFLTGRNTGSDVVSTETSLLITQNRDLFNQGPDTSNYGGGLFIGRSASPYGNLAALRDNNHRPIIYLAGRYPEISLIHEVPSNSNHAAGIRFATYVQSTNTATGNQFVIGTNGPGTYLDIGHGVAAQNQNVHAGISNHSGTTRFRVTTSGCQVFGSFSKSSGSFKIPHPLPEKTETHELVHSFIEGPQADLIYRGVVDLVDGTATVNIDTAGRMTEGTFEVLCTNVSCFTSNETDWTAVKGSISGNILTITAQDNTSTATVSWMVVGERKDQHMKDTNWTDDNGRVITEPLKSS